MYIHFIKPASCRPVPESHDFVGTIPKGETVALISPVDVKNIPQKPQRSPKIPDYNLINISITIMKNKLGGVSLG